MVVIVFMSLEDSSPARTEVVPFPVHFAQVSVGIWSSSHMLTAFLPPDHLQRYIVSL